MKYSSKLEWEFLQNDVNLIAYKIINDIPLYSIKSCNLKRGENFEIILDVNCRLDTENQPFFDNEFFINEIIFENYREVIKVKYCKIKYKTFSVGENSGYHFIFHVNHIERIYKNHDLENDVCYIKENVFTREFVNQFIINEENSENVDDSRETDDNPIKVVEMDGKLYLPLEMFDDWVNEDDEFRLLEFETKEYGEECKLNLKMARLVEQ